MAEILQVWVKHARLITRVKVFPYDLKLSHNMSGINGQTDGRTTTMPIARSLLKYDRLIKLGTIIH